jgi:hypothetical protein
VVIQRFKEEELRFQEATGVVHRFKEAIRVIHHFLEEGLLLD